MILKRTLYIFLFLNVHTLYSQDMNFQKNIDDVSELFKELEINEIRDKINYSQQIRLELSGNNFGFNPNEIFSIEEVGIYFPNVEISGNFGKIFTRKGTVLNNNEFIIFCDENTKFENDSIQDENIDLNLNDGYYLIKQENIYYIRYKKSVRKNI